MTSLSLLLWIVSAIVLQLAIFLGFVFWRLWLNYYALRSRAAELDLPAMAGAPGGGDTAVVAAWPGFRTFRVERKVVENAAQSMCSFYLVPEDGQALPPFLPGQYLTLRLDMPRVGGGTEQVVRCYSLSDAPRRDYYRISVKRMLPGNDHAPPGKASAFFHDQVVAGSLLQVRAPGGHFHIEPGDAPVVLIGCGAGITPMLSMLNGCMAEQPGREIWLFYGVRNGRELVMRQHLGNLAATHPNFRLRICLSEPLPDDAAGRDCLTGQRIDVNLLRMQLPLKPYRFYIAGPAPMIESLAPALEEWGVPKSRIHIEAFGPSSIGRKQAAPEPMGVLPQGEPSAGPTDAAIVVTFARSGKQVPWQPAAGNLLELAQANGIPVNFGCRAGCCGTCQTTIRAGEVAYRQPPDFDPEPGACLLCVCTPKTSVTLEA